MSVKTPTRTQFKQWQDDHPNFMTPTLERVAIRGRYVVELSSGESMDGGLMYGVSIHRYDGDSFVPIDNTEEVPPNTSSIGAPLHDKKQAEAYFKAVAEVVA